MASEPNVVFIVLNRPIRERMICDLADKFYNDGKYTLIACGSDEQSEHYDRLLWTWKQASFVPHSIGKPEGDAGIEPVMIITSPAQNPGCDILVLADEQSPDLMRSFPLVIDFADKYDVSRLTESRRRFKDYQSLGFKIDTRQPGEILHAGRPDKPVDSDHS